MSLKNDSRKSMWLALFLSGLTFASFFFLTSKPTSADSTTSASVSVNVAAACTFNTVEDTPHSATIPAGTYKSEIGSTNFTIVCNDTEGYSIYAIGYSNQEFGNNKLLANINGSSNSTYDINTGINTSGSPSSWAMKLIPGTGLTSSNILNGYGSYSIIPNQYVKVASLVPATNSATNNTSVLSATYAVNIAGDQPAGTYQGKVKYTMVHPASEVPTQPYDTTAGYIGYYPNASGVTDTMGDQSIGSTATSATLWASNFKRAGYGFVGWSDKYDWVVNANDANGNGTGANAGYHIYGPNQTINFTAGQYSGTNKGLSLYAVWVKNQGNLQNWNGCNAMDVGQVTALTDTRDGNTYAVAKLRDDADDATSGKCWMIENLRLGGETAMTLTSDTTNIADGTTFTLSASTDPTVGDGWCANNNAACIDKSMLASNNTTNTKNDMTAATLNSTDNTGIYSMGNYYNWYSATAGTGTYSTSANNTSVTSDICPKGWRLARGGNDANSSNSDFRQLAIATIGYDTNGSWSTGYGVYNNNDGSTKGTEASNTLRAYPNNIIYSGYANGSWLHDRGNLGNFWSSTAYHSGNAYYLYLYSSYLIPGTVSWTKYNGLTARCVAGS